MLGNAVCPPVISVLAGAILDHILQDSEDWVDKGLWTGIALSLEAVSPAQQYAVCDRLRSHMDEEVALHTKDFAPGFYKPLE